MRSSQLAFCVALAAGLVLGLAEARLHKDHIESIGSARREKREYKIDTKSELSVCLKLSCLCGSYGIFYLFQS